MAEGWLNHLKTGEDEGQEGSMGDLNNLDDSLTSLMWLQDFSVFTGSEGKSPCFPISPDLPDCHRMPSFAAPCSPLAADPACMGIPHTPCKPISSSTSRTEHHATAMHPQLGEEIDYKTNPHVKPPYSYATLICMAMEASDKPKITLSAIYKWITDNFCYFRHADPTWQNSIRHNLSLNKCFIKVPREKGEPGKGGFWKLDPQYADRLKNGTFKKLKTPSVQVQPVFTKKVQEEAQHVTSPATSTCTSNNILNVNMESQQLLKEFEEVTVNQNWNQVESKGGYKRKQALPERAAKVARLSTSALLPIQEEETQLGSLKGDFDWEAIFDSTLKEDFPNFGDLEFTCPLSSITHDLDLSVQELPKECFQGQEQVLTESDQNNLDFDETLMATAFLQHPWDEGTSNFLSDTINMEQLFELNDTSLPADVSNWRSMTSLL